MAWLCLVVLVAKIHGIKIFDLNNECTIFFNQVLSVVVHVENNIRYNEYYLSKVIYGK